MAARTELVTRFLHILFGRVGEDLPKKPPGDSAVVERGLDSLVGTGRKHSPIGYEKRVLRADYLEALSNLRDFSVSESDVGRHGKSGGR